MRTRKVFSSYIRGINVIGYFNEGQSGSVKNKTTWRERRGELQQKDPACPVVLFFTLPPRTIEGYRTAHSRLEPDYPGGSASGAGCLASRGVPRLPSRQCASGVQAAGVSLLATRNIITFLIVNVLQTQRTIPYSHNCVICRYYVSSVAK